MSFKTDFEKLIEMIELRSRKSMSAVEIARDVSKSIGINTRDLGTSFLFITGKSLSEYIKDRKMMAAYKYLIETENPKTPEAVDISGYDNQSSFNKRFKEVFKISPGQAVKEKDASLYKTWISWEDLESETEERKGIRRWSMNNNRVYGVALEDYNTICEVLELQSIYGLSEEMSRAAFDFSKKFNRPLSKTFQYFSEYVTSYEDYNYSCKMGYEDRIYPSEEEYIKAEIDGKLSDPEMCYLFFDTDFSEDIYDIISKAKEQGIEDVRSLSKTTLRLLASDIESYYGLKSAEYFDKHVNENYQKESLESYIQLIECGFDYWVAFNRLRTISERERLNAVWNLYDGEYFGYEKAYEDLEERNKDLIEDGYENFVHDVLYD